MATKKTSIKYTKDIQYYLDLPWTYIIEQAHDEKNRKIYIVRVQELPGVSTDALTMPKALESIKEAMALAFEMYLESGDEIPVPIDEDLFKGNIAYRTTSRRHYLIAKEAQKRSVSLSQVIDTMIDSLLSSPATRK
jgi:predicted RNase H-like HicB family nuclease